jgi:predicted nucleotide-binding protein (sugar kinase/HSP70/actin superfamily)
MRLGILRCLLFYPLGPFWETFFTELGFEVIVSPPLSRDHFNQEQRRFVGDICLPIESVSGHIIALQHQVDLIFIPRLTDRFNDMYICPVCAGLPDVIMHTLSNIPSILSIHLTPLVGPTKKDIEALSMYGCTADAITQAYERALGKYTDMEKEWLTPPRSTSSPSHSNLLLLGMPYVVGDSFINIGLPTILAKHKCTVSTALNISPKSAFNRVYVEGYPLYWSYAGMSVSALSHALKPNRPDGVIYLSSFACGVDSAVIPIVQSVCRRCENIPFLLLTVDEHASAAHIEIRVEAFLDCVENNLRRKDVTT